MSAITILFEKILNLKETGRLYEAHIPVTFTIINDLFHYIRLPYQLKLFFTRRDTIKAR